jgi:SAM-dependent methyltransferase
MWTTNNPEPQLDPLMWHGSFNGRESTLQQLSPYVGKLKSGMVRVLLDRFSQPGQVVLDPFCGSGVVPLEAALAGRVAWANDLSPYAYVLTQAKLAAPADLTTALEHALDLLAAVEQTAPGVDINAVPEWVRSFFHPDTLREILAAFRLLHAREDYFLMGCLLGILHHQRPGFLSFPSSHLVPYVRVNMFPPEKYPELYAYRDLRSRLIAKVRRAYKRPALPPDWSQRQYHLWRTNAMELPIDAASVDTIISSPPYFGALDYARDNRLRLWFLGCADWKQLDQSLTANRKVYIPQITHCLREMERALRPGGYCVLVLGDVERDGRLDHTAEILRDTAIAATDGRLIFDLICDDNIPDERRTRRRTRTTKVERILVMHKQGDCGQRR